MNKFTLFKLAIVFFIMLLLLVGFTFFRKENTKEINNTEEQSEIENITETKAEEDTELSPKMLEIKKAEAKQFAEIFCISYNTYEYENSSNIESLYYLMTDEFAQKIKNEYQEKKEFITIKPEIKNSEVLSFDGKIITIKINLEKKYFNGSFISEESSENDDNTKLVDINGNDIEGNLEQLLQKTEEQEFIFEAIFEENIWKINNIEKIN